MEWIPEAIAGTSLLGLMTGGFAYLTKAQNSAVAIYKEGELEARRDRDEMREELERVRFNLERLASPIRRLLSILNGHIPEDIRKEIEEALHH